MEASNRRLRVAGEFVLIVLGVLAALSAEAWWSAKQDRATEFEVLVSVRDELRENHALLRRARALSDSLEVSAYRLLELSTQSAPSISPDSLDALLGNLTWFAGNSWLSGAVDALVAGGDLALIEDRSLRTRLSAWLRRLEYVRASEAAQYQDYNERWLPFLARRAYVPQLANTQAVVPGDTIEARVRLTPWRIPLSQRTDHAELLGDREFQNFISFRLWSLQTLGDGYEAFELELNTLFEQVEAELAR